MLLLANQEQQLLIAYLTPSGVHPEYIITSSFTRLFRWRFGDQPTIFTRLCKVRSRRNIVFNATVVDFLSAWATARLTGTLACSRPSAGEISL